MVDENRKLQLGKPEDVQFVRDLFTQYAAGSTTRQLAQMAESRGYISSKGKPWSVNGITALLKKQVYIGHLVYGKHQYSKYQPRTVAGKHRPKQDWTVIENNHEPIVSVDLFNRVQQLLQERRTHTSPTGKASEFVLSGLVRCAHCGSSMHGDGYNGHTHYTCGTYKSRPGNCERYNVRQDQLLPQLLGILRDRLFKPAIIKQLRAELVKRLQQTQPTTDHADRLAAVDRKIAAAEQRLVEVSKDMIPRVEAQLRQLEQQRTAIQSAAAQEPQRPAMTQAEIASRVDAAVAWFGKLERLARKDCDPAKLRQMLHQFIEKVELNFERKLWGKSVRRHKCDLIGGVIHFRFMEVAHIGPLMRPM